MFVYWQAERDGEANMVWMKLTWPRCSMEVCDSGIERRNTDGVEQHLPNMSDVGHSGLAVVWSGLVRMPKVEQLLGTSVGWNRAG